VIFNQRNAQRISSIFCGKKLQGFLNELFASSPSLFVLVQSLSFTMLRRAILGRTSARGILQHRKQIATVSPSFTAQLRSTMSDAAIQSALDDEEHDHDSHDTMNQVILKDKQPEHKPLQVSDRLSLPELHRLHYSSPIGTFAICSERTGRSRV
jgi:hypothetical protein